ncbi:hypothetical protein A2U01_0052823, partial [Trifolium medium]|nr:hypothetical protein [Trifolium medium]
EALAAQVSEENFEKGLILPTSERFQLT